MKNHIFISVGSSIDRDRHITASLDALHQHFGPLELSPIYESEAVGFKGDPFYNLVVAAYTDLSILAVNQLFKDIEQANGRVFGEKKCAARTLDLDLLLYNDIVTEQPIVLPRDEILYHAFVLQPLADIAPDKTHPVTGQTYARMWRDFDKMSQDLWRIDFEWSAPIELKETL